jgi:hypothetical protein
MVHIPIFKKGTDEIISLPKGAYRTELIKRKKEGRLFCPSLISVAVSVIIIIIYHATTVIEAVFLE